MVVIILQNDVNVPAGYLLSALERHGLEHRILFIPENPSYPDLSGAAAVVSLGGRQGAYETNEYPYLQEEMDYMLKACTAGVPVLGICLGCQLLARALGASSFRAPSSELGFAASYPVRATNLGLSDPVVQALLPHMGSGDGEVERAGVCSDQDHTDHSVPPLLNENIFSFHSDTFSLPPDFPILASSRYPQVRLGRCVRLAGTIHQKSFFESLPLSLPLYFIAFSLIIVISSSHIYIYIYI